MLISGEIFALITAFGWACSSIFFEIAAKKSDSPTVNTIRLMIGITLLGFLGLFTKGRFFPTDSSLDNWTFLGISGIIGLFLGDLFLYQSYILIGARISVVFMSMRPILVGFLSSFILDEKLGTIQLLAMLITCSGILLVILKPKSENTPSKKITTKGLFIISSAVLLDALGTIFTKIGSTDYDPGSSTQIRMICALGAFVIYLTFYKKWSNLKKAFVDKKLIILIAIGTFTATTGITFLVAAFQKISASVASTISSVSPIIVIPISVSVFKDKVTWRDLLGAVISVLGVALFFLIK